MPRVTIGLTDEQIESLLAANIKTSTRIEWAIRDLHKLLVRADDAVPDPDTLSHWQRLLISETLHNLQVLQKQQQGESDELPTDRA